MLAVILLKEADGVEEAAEDKSESGNDDTEKKEGDEVAEVCDYEHDYCFY